MTRAININDLRPFAAPRSRVTNPTALMAIARNEERRRAAFDIGDNNLGDIIVGASAGTSMGSDGKVGASAGASYSGNQGREVLIEIKGSVSSALFWPSMLFYNEPEWIKNVLEARGWDITRSVETSSGVAGLGTRTWRVTANVLNQFSDSQIVTNARNHLVEKGMTVSSVNIVQASPASYVQGVNAGSGGDGSNVGVDINSMIAGAAVGLGVSSTVLLVGGAAVLVLLLRRR